LLLFQSLQDLGNVNLSFFTPRELYNRKQNLALIVKVLRERWKLDVEASPRDDILVDGKYKISFLSYSNSITCWGKYFFLSKFKEGVTWALAGFHVGLLSWLNWNLEILVFVLGARREPMQQTQPTYDIRPEPNLGCTGGRRVLLPLHHPCSSFLVNYIVKLVVDIRVQFLDIKVTSQVLLPSLVEL